MTPSVLRARIVTARLSWVRDMTGRIRALPLATHDTFAADPRTPAAAESYLRRGLEALLDLGRHILAKGFGVSAAEYKEIAARLEEVGVLDAADRRTLTRLAGYRNRLVHFYDEISERELYEICTAGLGDVERISAAMAAWANGHPERFDQRL
jgi:uncharacterized protein YutE (UPF0331/DUF86 family)